MILSEDLATSNLALSVLPCGHCFHAKCIHAARTHLQPDSMTGRMDVVSEHIYIYIYTYVCMYVCTTVRVRLPPKKNIYFAILLNFL